MKRSELEHIIRASGSIANDNEIIVIGSQAILGQYPNASEEFLFSMEADVIPKNHPEKADLIDGTIGELSPFHMSFGYYAHGVSIDTAILPTHWKNRLIKISNPNTSGVTGLCLEVNDLAISKCVAGREKDNKFVKALINENLVNKKILLERLSQTDINQSLFDIIKSRLENS